MIRSRTMKGRGWRLARRCGGWGTSEYVVVLLAMILIWDRSGQVLDWIREHHREFSWALMVPF